VTVSVTLGVRMIGSNRASWSQITRRAVQAKELMLTDLKQGEAEFERLLFLYPADGMVFYQRGLAYESLDIYERARDDYAQAEHLFPRTQYKLQARTGRAHVAKSLEERDKRAHAVMRCPNCGLDNSTGARYCTRCGAELMAPAHDSLQPGQTMDGGQYRITRRLGKGGMGAIYLAENTQAFNRTCVIKEMLAYYQPGEEHKAQQRFEQEARTLAALKHPGIPDMYGYFSERGHNYIVMEYIEGENLERFVSVEDGSGERVRRKEIKAEEIVRYGVQICRVLEYLSRVRPKPVVHCDIKPANIIIDRNSQQAVLVDFGTAKARYLRRLRASPDKDRDSVYGTVGYAPPELYRGQAGAKSDVFSLAATMYHLLTDDDPRDHPFKWPEMDRVPATLHLTLKHALANEVSDRLDAEQFRRQLESYRASQAGAVQPITFPGGNLATTLTGLLDLSLRYWDYARGILYDGSLDAWLRQALHDPVTANRAAEVVRENPDQPNAGLDEFLRGINPRMPAPRLALAPRQLDLGTIAPGKVAGARLILANRGPGGSRGNVQSSTPWLRVNPATFALGPKENCAIQVVLTDTEHLPTRKSHTFCVLVHPTTGQPIEARVQVRVSKRPTRLTSIQRTGARPTVQVRPPKAARSRKSTPLTLVLLAALLAIAALVALRPWGIGSAGAGERGMAALQQAQWGKAARYLSQIDPQNDRGQVHEAAQLLDETTVVVPGGALQMGRAGGAEDQRPVHYVQVENVQVDRFEVTNIQYQRFVDETGYPPPHFWTSRHYPQGEGMCPVVGVDWDAAVAYANWAGKRLPSEAEWEWAARGTEGRLYPWGDDHQATTRANTADLTNTTGPIDVGSYPLGATPLGIMDLAGNVREWTADRYAPYSLPRAPVTPGGDVAVRGGSWRRYNDYATARDKVASDNYADDLGFRCVKGPGQMSHQQKFAPRLIRARSSLHARSARFFASPLLQLT